MSAETALLAGRDLAEQLMQDACSITRASTTTTWDDVLGREVPGAPTTVWTGPCRVQQQNIQPAQQAAGEFVWTIQDVALQLPMRAPVPQVGDDVVITACPYDPSQAGRRLRVKAAIPAKTHATRRTVACTEVTE
jgi:hypothetical protein